VPAWLSFHTGYACRDSGICCTSGWPIPVETERVPAIEAAIHARMIPIRVVPWLTPELEAPGEIAGTLTVMPNGQCVFFEAGRPRCAIHPVKPASCMHFPYICLVDPRGVRVNLSHYCPTAASMLFEHDGPIEIVDGPSPVPDDVAIEGLDARDSLPPAVAGRLLAWDEFSHWEREAIVRANVDVLQRDDLRRFDEARSAVPAPWTWPAAPPDFEAAWWSMVAPEWTRFEGALRRYAAAKIFASWAVYQGDGLEAAMRVAATASAVLRIECARRCIEIGQPLDRQLLEEAIRQSDLLLVHYADPERLAKLGSGPR
jgi:Fe-S-cluster containining protein